jgi:hypothetical protein
VRPEAVVIEAEPLRPRPATAGVSSRKNCGNQPDTQVFRPD